MQKVSNALHKAYGFEITKIRNIEYGLREESFEVQTLSKNYFAKRFWMKSRVNTRYNEMFHGILLSQELRENGFPVPKLILTKDRMPFAHIDDETYQVTEWVDGSTFHPGELPQKGAYSMGCLLGKFHSYFKAEKEYKSVEVIIPSIAVKKCENLYLKFEQLSGKFPNCAKLILSEEIKILKKIADDFIKSMNTVSRICPIYGSFWVEQILFDDNLEIKALVDWTDGAGRIGNLSEDIDVAIHVSAFNKESIVAFCTGYQRFNPLDREEWEAVLNLICYRHLTDTWVFDSWLDKSNRRLEHWENIAINWISQIPGRFYEWEDIKKLVFYNMFL